MEGEPAEKMAMPARKRRPHKLLSPVAPVGEETVPLRVNVLGAIEVLVGDEAIRLAGQRERALLAALTLGWGKPVPVGRLIDFLWDSEPPVTARAKIQTYVSRLRQAIGDDSAVGEGPILTQAPGYALSYRNTELDLAEFDALSAQADEAAEAGQPAVTSRLLATALDLWRDSAFADVESPMIQSAADNLSERRLLGVEAKAEADLALERSDRVVAEILPWVVENPFRERMRAILMHALYRRGCRADALAQYHLGREALADELGLEPGPQLRDLHARILADDPVLLAVWSKPDLESGDGPPPFSAGSV
jgi:DNA-binding SARP family transcriptional activator